MSRRSLRLHMPPPYGDTSPLDHSLHYGSASFSAGVTSRRETKLLKSKRSQQHSVSCSQSLLQTPRKQSSLPLHNSSLHSAASDASLLSSLLDESSIQDRTLVDSFWGLDQDADPKDITVMSERSLALANSTLISPGEDHCPNHPAQIQTSMVNGYYCNDCALQSDREEVLTATHSPSKYAVSSAKASRLLHYQVPNQEPTVGATILLPSTIHCRDKSHKAKTGLCVSTWALVTSVCRRSLAWLALLITLLYKRILFRKDQYNTGVLKSMRDSSLLFYRRTAASIVTALTLTLQFSKRLGMQAWKAALLCWKGWRKVQADEINGKLVSRAYSRSCGNVNLDECGAYNKCLNLSGSLCKAVSDVFWCLERGWYYTITFMSLLSCFLLNRCLPNLFRCALILVLLLFLCSVLGWWDPSDLLSSLTAVSATDWQAGIPGLSFILNLTSTWRWLTPPREESGDVQTYTPAPHVLPLTQEALIEGAQSPDSARLLRLERGLSQLWQRVEAGGRRAEQQHSVLLRLHEELGRRLHEEAPGDSEESRLRATLEERLSELRAQLVEDRTRREQTQKQFLVQQQSQASRLAQLELLLQAVAAKMEHVQQRQEAAMTLPVPSTTTLPVSDSVGVDRDSYDALVAEVAQLGVALGSVRQDLEGLSRCQDNAHETISARVSTQVHEELHALLYGNQLANVSPPDSLLQWLTESYVSKADLRAALASLEHGILKNISLQVEQPSEPQPSSVEAAQNELHSTGAAVTQEQVQLMVKSALRLYSQDRTGLADYALESGGGSILSTRCSETYETKTALLSLFGLPLWYFSQSPRVVIQPDIHPGNCWAFKGSHGYLVIRLSMAIVPTAFSLEHIPKALAPTGTLRSAPRDFTIYGLDNEGHEKGKLLGSYRYEEDGEAVQTYPVSEENEQRYQIIEVRILSNWGHQDYTCLYRVRVHGSPSNN